MAFLAEVKKGKVPDYRRILIVGNPGIGKTASMNYYIAMALRENYPVLIETRDKRYFIDSGADDVQVEDVLIGIKLRAMRFDPSVLFFHDHQPGAEPPIIDSGAFTVAPVSPAIVNLKEYSKHVCLELWMPLPKFEEVLAIKSVIRPSMSNDELQRRCDLVGPILRQVFTPNFDNYMLPGYYH